MLIARVRYPVYTLGPGVRAGVWTQGCGLACEGCVARDTWPADPAADVPVGEVLEWIGGLPKLDGLTLSGGEPLDQPEDLRSLLEGVRAQGRPGLDVLLFTGRTLRAARRAFPEVLALVDAVVAGPFRRDRPTEHPLMGSANQELATLTALGAARYAELPTGGRRPVQASIGGDGRLHTVGIPNQSDLARLQETALARGFAVDGLGRWV